MRNLILIGLIASSYAFAGAEHEGPCKKIVEACEAGGYAKGAHKKTGKGAYVDCLDKLLAGETVAGVNASAADIAKCKEHKAKWTAKKK